MVPGNSGIYGICGNLFSVSYGRQRCGKRPIPTSRPKCTERNR